MDDTSLTIAAAGDLHCDRERVAEIEAMFDAAGRGRADLILLAGDLTTHGEPEEAEILVEAAAGASCPVIAVLGNHDWHADRADSVAAVLRRGGIEVLDRSHVSHEIRGSQVGVAGAKGFVGGFPGSHIPDFGEPLMHRLYAETTAEVEGLDRALKEIALCHYRLVLLHYSPTGETLRGEPPGIWAMLGSDRLAAPLREHEPTIVFHGHAHYGSPRGRIGEVPVANVSLPLVQGPISIHELGFEDVGPGAVH